METDCYCFPSKLKLLNIMIWLPLKNLSTSTFRNKTNTLVKEEMPFIQELVIKGKKRRQMMFGTYTKLLN